MPAPPETSPTTKLPSSMTMAAPTNTSLRIVRRRPGSPRPAPFNKSRAVRMAGVSISASTAAI